MQNIPKFNQRAYFTSQKITLNYHITSHTFKSEQILNVWLTLSMTQRYWSACKSTHNINESTGSIKKFSSTECPHSLTKC